MNYFMNNYGNANPYPGQQSMMQMKTNIILVTSLEDALSRYAEPNSNMLYCDQDKPLGYNIMTDSFGRKTHKIINMTEQMAVPTSNQNNYVKKEDVEEIVKKYIDSLNNKEVLE